MLYCISMDTLQQAMRVLSETERSLRDLTQTALSSGEYASVAHLARLTEQVALINKNQSPTSLHDSGTPNGQSEVPRSPGRSDVGAILDESPPARSAAERRRPRNAHKAAKFL